MRLPVRFSRHGVVFTYDVDGVGGLFVDIPDDEIIRLVLERLRVQQDQTYCQEDGSNTSCGDPYLVDAKERE